MFNARALLICPVEKTSTTRYVPVPNGVTDFPITLAAGARTTIVLPISGDVIGDGTFQVNLVMPGGEVLPKDFQLGVRAPGAPETQRNIVTILP